MQNSKTITLVLFTILNSHCSNFQQVNNCPNSQQEERKWETIKGNLRSGDTVFLVNEWTISSYQGDTFVSRNAVYFESDKSSGYYRARIGDFSLKDWDGENRYHYYLGDENGYVNINNHFYEYGIGGEDSMREVFVNLTKKKIPENLPTRWIPLYLYNNQYYLYAPCQWIISRYDITDTLLMYYGWMDGVYGFSYDKIVQKSKNHYIIQNIKGFHNKEINIYIMDREKGIAVFEYDDYEPCLYVDAEKIGNFPVIVHYCEELEDEYEFSDIELKELMKKIIKQ